MIQIMNALPLGIAVILFVAVLIVTMFVFACIYKRAFIKKILFAIRQNIRNLSMPFAISIIMHILFGTAVFLAAKGIGTFTHYGDTIFAVASSILFSVIPISFAGVGPVEAGGTAVFLAIGYTVKVAAVMVLISYSARALGAIEGGIWEMLSGNNFLFKIQQKIREKMS